MLSFTGIVIWLRKRRARGSSAHRKHLWPSNAETKRCLADVLAASKMNLQLISFESLDHQASKHRPQIARSSGFKLIHCGVRFVVRSAQRAAINELCCDLVRNGECRREIWRNSQFIRRLAKISLHCIHRRFGNLFRRVPRRALWRISINKQCWRGQTYLSAAVNTI